LLFFDKQKTLYIYFPYSFCCFDLDEKEI
jgi:hypothetical protein